MTEITATSTCSSCGIQLSESQAVLIQGKRKTDHPISLCHNCLVKVEKTIQEEIEEVNYFGALLFGIIAAAISALIWYGVVIITNYEIGIISIAVGWLVAQGVMLGAGRKRGPALQVISVVITIGAMAVSEYLIVRHFLIQLLAEEGYFVSEFPILLPLEDVLLLIVEGIKNDLITLVFWVIAIWQAFSLPAKRRLRKVAE